MLDPDHLKPLKPKQKKFLVAILSGQSIRQASETIGVAFETGRGYYHNYNFRRALEIESNRLYEQNFALLVGLGSKAIERISTILEDPESSNRDILRATEIVLSFSIQYRSILLNERLEKLEKLVNLN